MQSTLLNCSKTVWLALGKTYNESVAENNQEWWQIPNKVFKYHDSLSNLYYMLVSHN
jgi:hypothetical protein